MESHDAALHEVGNRAAAAEAQVAAERAKRQALRALSREATARVAELERVASRLAAMVVDRDKELQRLRAAFQAALEQEQVATRALVALAEDLEAVRRQARSQATRIRMRALHEAARLVERAADAQRGEGEQREHLVARLEEAIERVGRDGEDEEQDRRGHADRNGRPAREPGELFDGLVEVEVGPLRDFSQLVGFEDAAAAIASTSEISVKRFTQGRATLAMRFKHPVELLRELEERAPFEFAVRDTRPSRVVLDVDE